jgi:multiple sugar transport system permease protein
MITNISNTTRLSRNEKKERAGQFIAHIAMLVIALAFIVPFLWMLLSSFKTSMEIIKIPPTFIPKKFTFSNYKIIFERLNFLRYFMNSIAVSLAITVFSMFASSIAGFVFAKFKFPAKEVLFIVFLTGLMIPFAVVVIPMYLLVAKFNWTDNYLGIIVPLTVSPFGIPFGTFLMRQFMEGIPMEMVEAARIDGASNFWIYFRVMLPLSTAGLGGVGIFTFLFMYNQLWWPLMVISKQSMRTLPLGIASLTFQQIIRYDMIVTGASIAIVPMMIIFAFAQQRLVKGVTLTGLKI